MEATLEEASVAAKLFKILTIVCNVNVNSFELQLEVEDRIQDFQDIQSLEDDKDDPDFLSPKSKIF